MEMDRAEQTEQWFVRRGLPHFIDHYSVTTDVFTRAAPFLAVVFVSQVFLSFDEDRSGLAEFGPFVGAIAVLGVAVVLLNRGRGRRAFQRPDRVSFAELAVFVLAPAFIPVIFRDGDWAGAAGTVVANLVILGVAYVVTSYGLLPMTRWAVGQMIRQLGDLANLMVRSLPLLLLFATFLFLNAEIWQVASDFEAPFFWITVAMLFAAGVFFLALRLPSEVGQISRFRSWDEIGRLAADSPMGEVAPPALDEAPDPPELGKRARLNLALVLVFSQGIQILLVAVAIGAFYLLFGLFTVRETTILQWTTSDSVDLIGEATWFGHQVVFTWELVRVAGFIAAFSGLYFTVSALTDDTYRREFFQDIVDEVREALAVRALYLVTLTDAGPVADEAASDR